MFVSNEVTLDAAFEVTSARLLHLINHSSLHDVSELAYDEGLQTLRRVGPLGSAPGLSKLVRIRTLEPVRHDRTMSVALRWEATGPVGELFPILDADLILTGDGDDRSQLRLMGTYRPPLGQAGAIVDRAIMNRVAAATIRSLVNALAASIAAPAPERGVEPNIAPRRLPAAEPGQT
jgi:hypothetical protein